jgi:hypothetical protein
MFDLYAVLIRHIAYSDTRVDFDNSTFWADFLMGKKDNLGHIPPT